MQWAQGWGTSLGTFFTLDNYVVPQWCFSNARNDTALGCKSDFRACRISTVVAILKTQSLSGQSFLKTHWNSKISQVSFFQWKYLSSAQFYPWAFFCCFQSFSAFLDPPSHISQTFFLLFAPATQVWLFSQPCSSPYLFPIFWKNLVFLCLLSELPWSKLLNQSQTFSLHVAKSI